jgi:NTP pyrophosphatase (non-canonical NTP hydrolase)
MIEELGDVLWYCAELACGLGVTLDEVAMRNIDKLRRRYPEGFDAERSINRDD